jgi:hypothetical protein
MMAEELVAAIDTDAYVTGAYALARCSGRPNP